MMFPSYGDERGDFTALVLAAGDSERMGQPKATLRIRNQPAWLRVARICISAGARQVLILVSATTIEEVRAKLPIGASEDRKMVPLNVPEKLRKLGPIGSIMHGLKRCRETPGWLLWPVDHPFVSTTTIRALVTGEGLIRLPNHDGKRGHPIYLESSCADELKGLLQRGKTLRDYVHAHRREIADIDVNDEAIHWNCNSPANFRSRLAQFEGQR